MIYLDTSCLVKLYFPEPDSARVIGLVSGHPLLLTALHELEVNSALSQKLFRKTGTSRQVAAARAAVVSDVRAGVLVRAVPDWETILAEATTVATTRGRKLGCRSLDIIHCCAARALTATAFVTNDDRQRTLARHLGLVCPTF